MTREEAIRQIENRLGIMDYGESEALGEALDMAIEALKTAEINCVHCPHYHETEDETGVHSHCGGGDAEMNEVKSPYMQQSPNSATHGRLIDADALSKKLCETTIFIKDGEVFQRMINDAPTVPVVDITQRDLCENINCEDCPFMKETCKLMDYVSYADRPHGEWIEREDWNGDSYYDCSVCGESFVLCDGTPSMNQYNFCPNCGADMRGGRNE